MDYEIWIYNKSVEWKSNEAMKPKDISSEGTLRIETISDININREEHNGIVGGCIEFMFLSDRNNKYFHHSVISKIYDMRNVTPIVHENFTSNHEVYDIFKALIRE